MIDTYLSLGSNLGDRQAYLKAALKGLEELPETILVAVSNFYQTPAWGKTDQDDFLNLCVHIKTQLAPQELLAHTQSLELKLGRERHEHWGPRTIDIDVLLMGDLIIDEPNLKVPHPYMDQRAFVLLPLADLAPELKHPLLLKTIAELLEPLDVSDLTLLEEA